MYVICARFLRREGSMDERLRLYRHPLDARKRKMRLFNVRKSVLEDFLLKLVDRGNLFFGFTVVVRDREIFETIAVIVELSRNARNFIGHTGEKNQMSLK